MNIANGRSGRSSSNRDRLTQETSSRFGGYTENNAYDSAGNPTTFRRNSRTYNTNNQVTATNLSSSFTYDGNGNPTTYGGKTAVFDVENRMTAFPNGANTWGAGYRADGLRAWTRASSTGSKTYYYYDQGNAVLETNSSGVILARNIFASDGLVARKLAPVGGLVCTGEYLFDWQGNAVHCLYSGGTLLEDGEPLIHSAYNAWGQRNFVYSNGASSASDLLRFGYNAHWGYKLDTETGLYYCQHRYYDPQNGRWVTRDPVGWIGGMNVYGYCFQSPVSEQDASGLKPPCKIGSQRERNCTDFLTPDDLSKYSSGLFKCIRDSKGDPKEAAECVKKFVKSQLTDSLIEYIACMAGSKLSGGTPGINPSGPGGGSDDYTRCWQAYIRDILKCAKKTKGIAIGPCMEKARTEFTNCLGAADPHDGR